MADENKEEVIENNEEALLEEVTSENTEKKDENEKEDKKQTNKKSIQKDKSSKIKKILIILIAILLTLILIGAILYGVGYFDPKEIKEDVKKPKVIKEKETYKFNLNDINSSKLNKQLAQLTNKNYMSKQRKEELEKLENEKKILEEEKKKYLDKLKNEEKKLAEEKEELENKKNELEIQKNELEKLKEEALFLKDQMIKNKVHLENLPNEENIKEDKENEEENTKTEENKFLMLINVAKIHGELYKDYLDSILKINPNILLCRDNNNKIEIYYGPFNTQKERTNLHEKLIINNFKESYELELTKNEFDKRCNY